MKGKIKKVPFYSAELKKQIVKEITNGEITVSGAMNKYSIGCERSIYRWLKRYKKFSETKKAVTLPIMKEEKQHLQDLSKEELLQLNIKLEAKLKQSQLEAEANKILVDIAKEQFNIDLRKKHGAKQ